MLTRSRPTAPRGDLNGAVRIPSGRRRIALGYAGLSLSVPERVRFRYRLDGFDGDWSDAVAERQAIYTNLAPGPYRFRVIASNSDGLWNGPEATLAFEVEPRFWQTAAFASSRGCRRPGCLGPVPVPPLAGGETAEPPVRRTVERTNPHRAGTARHPAAGFRQRVDAASRGGRAAAGGLGGEIVGRRA